MPHSNPPQLEDIPGIGNIRAQALRDAGYETVDDLQRASEAELVSVEGIHSTLAHDIKATVSPVPEPPTPTTTMEHITPEDWHITPQQANHLATEAGVSSDDLIDSTAADVADHLEWRIDPELLGFRRICGRVVKRDPTTDELLPVPNATVHVQDTDCDFLGYFPSPDPWGWFLPLGCNREEIATVTTDACGRFCVLVPRWEIDRILKFRRDRICLPELFDPTIKDLLEHLDICPDPLCRELPDLREPRPRPDPAPFPLREPGVYNKLNELIGEDTTNRLFALTAQSTFGDSTREIDELLDQRALTSTIEPPKPAEVPDVIERPKQEVGYHAVAIDRFQPAELEIEPQDFIGPFLRCRDVVIPEWVTVFDVPDITFHVTQDIDGDGDEETVYSEGFFDVRWNDLDDSEIVLEASEIAQTVPPCDPAVPPLECDQPDLRLIGAMPIAGAYHSNDSPREGYALKVNRPRPGSDDAATPYTGRLNLYGCGFRDDEAEYYRLVYRYRSSPSDSPTDAQPFTDLDWYAVRENWPPVTEHIRPVDDDGWYRILDPDVLVDRYQNLLLHWDTRRDNPNHNGLYDIRLELADGSRNRLEDETSDWLTIRIDNTRPTLRFDTLEWRTLDGSESGTLPLECPVIERPLDADGNPKTIEIDVSYTVQHRHLRNLHLGASGCGGGSPTKQGADADFAFWYSDPDDSYYSRDDATFRVQGGPEGAGRLSAGAYTIELTAWSRAFNPTRATGGIDHDWEIDPNHVGKHNRLPIAIVNGT